MLWRIEGDLSHWNGLLNSLNSCKTSGCFVSCPKQDLDKEGIALQKIGSLEYFLNRIRTSNPRHNPYNQTWVKYPPPPHWDLLQWNTWPFCFCCKKHTSFHVRDQKQWRSFHVILTRERMSCFCVNAHLIFQLVFNM